MHGRTLVLLSCSRYKWQGGSCFDDGVRAFVSKNSLPKLSGKMFFTRRHILNLLRGEAGKLYNKDQQGGFRHETIANRTLQPGQDFGGQAPNAGVYLPAHKRYAGRFFNELERIAPTFWSKLPKYPIEILFVSGLYGLLYWDEPIQEYDCHLSDYFGETQNTKKIADLWKPLLTDALCEFMRAEQRRGWPIRHVFDLLSEELYQEIFDWDRLRQAGIEAYHRVCRPLAGPDILPLAANVLATQLPRFYEDSQRFKRGIWLTHSLQPGSSVAFSFEDPLGTDPRATREGGTDRARESILKVNPRFCEISHEILQELVLAEHSWQKVESSKNFHFGALVVSYATPVQHWVETKIPDDQLQERREGWGMPRIKPSGSIWSPLAHDVDELWTMRNKGAHEGAKTTAKDVQKARSLTYNILARALEIWVRSQPCT